MSRLSHFLDNRLTDGGDVVSPTPQTLKYVANTSYVITTFMRFVTTSHISGTRVQRKVKERSREMEHSSSMPLYVISKLRLLKRHLFYVTNRVKVKVLISF
jgi:hypothetical protein